MSSPSNLYAEKIFSEHPLCLWALDDALDYVSLINESHRDMSNWNISGGVVQQSTFINEPFQNSVVSKISGNVIQDGLAQIELVSNSIGVSLSDLNSQLSSFNIGAYFYANNPYISSIEIGYRYFDEALATYITNTKTLNTSISNRWIFISETFGKPSASGPMFLVIRINYIGGGQQPSDNEFFINGVSLGQWSENFNSTSLGVTPIPVPQNIPVPDGLMAIEAAAYGLQNLSGYYFVKENALLAKNASLPMVYGTSNVTILSPNNGNPSLVIPGFGFLNETGRYNNFTLEAWLRINSDSSLLKRIIGPIASDDGIYVHGPNISLKVGNSIGHFYIGEWYRPMLIHLRFSQNQASLLINSEEVISIDIDNSVIFPDKLNSSGKDNDWIAFYAYDDISPIEIDCVAIYPYIVSQVVAKRRFVYGQGVEFPENINTAYSGSSIFIDYPFANYSNSYSYPDMGKWQQGIVENLSVDNNMLSTKNPVLPEVVFDNKTNNEWFTDLKQAQNEFSSFITLRPSSSWDSTNGHIYFNNLDMISEDIKSFYGIFKQKVGTHFKQTLFEIVDKQTDDKFKIILNTDSIDYVLTYNGKDQLLYTAQKHYHGENFAVGINIDTLCNSLGGNLPAFFGRKESLSFYVGGNKDLSQTFVGNIYTVGFLSKNNLSKISNSFNNVGIISDQPEFPDLDIDAILDGGDPETLEWILSYDGGLPATIATIQLSNHIPSYGLYLNSLVDTIFLDVMADSYWEDYLPATYLSKYVKDSSGNPKYDLDFVQFNINYPAPSKFIEEESSGSWTYEELQESFAHPIQRTYESLDNALFTGYNDYSDLKNKSIKTYRYDTSTSLLRSFITFQYAATGASKNYLTFTNIQLAPKNGVIRPGSNGENWSTTRYEVVDGMVIYPPVGISIDDLIMVTHLEIKSKSLVSQPINIRKLQFASQSLDSTSPNTIGTRFGNDIYPYRKSGLYFDYKGDNPFTIYRGSSPYLYLTKTTGIELAGDYDPQISRGLSIPINKEKSDDYKVIAMQAGIRYGKDFFPYAPVQIFEIKSKTAHIKFYMVANHPSGKRAKIYAINAKTGAIENGIGFYWNGKITKEPNITIKEWGMLGIRFASSLNFNNYSGAIRITGPLLTNNVSFYQSTNLQEVQQVANRPWFRVKTSGLVDYDWEYWDTSFNWNGVLVISATSYYGVDPSDIYKAYTGTNKIIVDDTREFTFRSYEYNVIKDVSWESIIQLAV